MGDRAGGETRFSLRANPEFHFGAGKAAEIPGILRRIAAGAEESAGAQESAGEGKGLPVLLVLSRSFAASPAGRQLEADCREAGLDPAVRTVHGEPSPETVDALAEEFRGAGLAAAAAVGGGSVLDAGKAAAAMICESGGSVKEYLEGVGSKSPSGRTVPLAAVPTTAGTGSEATKNAVISEPGPEGFKKSLRHVNYVPRAAVVDPELSRGIPEEVRTACAMDALSQLLEARLSRGGNPLTRALAVSGLQSLLPAVRALAFSREPGADHDSDVRAGLAYGAYLSGVCLAHAGLGAVHGAAGPLGGYCAIPHGTACGLLLPPVMRRTWEKDSGTAGSPGGEAFRRELDGLAGELGKDLGKDLGWECGEDLILFLEELAEAFSLPRLGTYGLTEQVCRRDLAGRCGSKSHPLPLDRGDFAEILVSLL